MAEKMTIGRWSMRQDREPIELAKTHTLEAIADRLRRSPTLILKVAADLAFRSGGRR
jgi:hypothetical protein